MKETAAMIGISAQAASRLFDPPISPKRLIAAAKAGQIPAKQIGARYLFNPDALAALISEKPEPAARAFNGGRRLSAVPDYVDERRRRCAARNGRS